MILTGSFISRRGRGVQVPPISWGTLWRMAFPLLIFIATLPAFFFARADLRYSLGPRGH